MISSSVTVPMTMAIMAVSVAIAAMLEHPDANNVNQEPEDGHQKQPLVLDLRRLNQSLDSLRKDEETDEKQKEAVDESSQDLGSDITVTKTLV